MNFTNDELVKQIASIIRHQSNNNYRNWIFWSILNGSFVASFFYQASEGDGSYHNLYLGNEANNSLHQLFRSCWEEDRKNNDKTLTSIIFVCDRIGHCSLEYDYGNTAEKYLSRVSEQVIGKYMKGLKFVPDPPDNESSSVDDKAEDLGQIIDEVVPESYTAFWVRCIIENGKPAIVGFFQPERLPGVVARLAFSGEKAESIEQAFLELRKVSLAEEPKPWTVATLIMSTEGDLSVETYYNKLGNKAKFLQEWEKKHFTGLSLVPPLPAVDEVEIASAALERLFEESVQELRAKTAVHNEISQAKSWAVDQDRGVIRFEFGNGNSTIAPVQIIGTLNTNDGTWLWAWDNPSVIESMRKSAMKLRDYGLKHGFTHLTKSRFVCTEDLAQKFAALACRIEQAQGVYRANAGSAIVWMIFGGGI